MGSVQTESKGKNVLLKAWSFSFACAIGWGVFVMPGTFYLPVAGFWGSLLSFVLGAAGISFIALNYHLVANAHRGAGGIYRLVAQSMGRPHGFAAGWSIILAYLCCFSLNARAMAMLLRTILEEILQVDFDYYLIPDNILLVDAVIILLLLIVFAQLNIRGITRLARIQMAGALLLMLGILIMFFSSVFSTSVSIKVPVITDRTKDLWPGFFSAFVLIPWAFVGFDSICKLHKEILFPKKRMALVMILSVICAAFAYIACMITALYGIPQDTASFGRLNLQLGLMPGAEVYPVAVAARNALGRLGIPIFYISALSATLTGLVGFSVCTTRIVSQMAQAEVLPPPLGEPCPKHNTPRTGIVVITILAGLLILLMNTYDFIEELASASTAAAYGYISVSAIIIARRQKRTAGLVTGIAGSLFSLLWLTLMLIRFPRLNTTVSIQAVGSMVLWVFLGIAAYTFFTRKSESYRSKI